MAKKPRSYCCYRLLRRGTLYIFDFILLLLANSIVHTARVRIQRPTDCWLSLLRNTSMPRRRQNAGSDASHPSKNNGNNSNNQRSWLLCV